MSNIIQKFEGKNLFLVCKECGVREEVSTSAERRNIDIQIKNMEKDHKHPGKEK